MISLLLYCDGPRDEASIPPLVGKLLGVRVQGTLTPWARLNKRETGSGYRRKLRFAIDQARDAGADGILAAVDRDKDRRGEKLKELQRARDEDRAASPPFPTVLAEANPHGEAWLLDDEVAVRRALDLDDSMAIQRLVRQSNPKDVLESLRKQSNRSEAGILEIMEDIANQVEPKRCRRAKETGFEAFSKEVRQEFTSLANQCGEDCRCGDVCAEAEDESEV